MIRRLLFLSLFPFVVMPLLVACTSGGSSRTQGDCTIEYDILGEEPSSRFDNLYVEDDGTVRRVVHGNGGPTTAAIWYTFDDDGQRVGELLDGGADGSIDARLDRVGIFGSLSVHQVDAITSDDQLEVNQFSFVLPSSSLGNYTPARVFYSRTCSPARQIDVAGSGDLLIDDDGDGDNDASFVLTFENDLLVRWEVDEGVDGSVDHVATVSYNADGQVTETNWADGSGSVYERSVFAYSGGHLSQYEGFGDGGSSATHRIRYHERCFAPQQPAGDVDGGAP